ncbi:hypothetical protein THAOC_32048 [Thalassiosira oceanica]|uniref:Uncharacterized protein n=1 Tax=Thalassiosira oceanica TaxID=159749 RepID=K0RA48_THAOC|nr:hypothetical protein THAOC_32048 [Thalassiosira oceanica]|eukprot:EJK49109.1 hypothetical protein THAOC_32048 [Thalassiosira oceanica]
MKTEDTDEENEVKPSPIERSNLTELTPLQSTAQKYPPGCPVYFRLQTFAKGMDGKSGTVNRVYIDLLSRRLVYEINMRSTGGRGLSSSELVYEEDMAFAPNCEVLVRGIFENDRNKQTKGRIICPHPAVDSSDSSLSYTVQFLIGKLGFVRVVQNVQSRSINFSPSDTDTEVVACDVGTQTIFATCETGIQTAPEKDTTKDGEGSNLLREKDEAPTPPVNTEPLSQSTLTTKKRWLPPGIDPSTPAGEVPRGFPSTHGLQSIPNTISVPSYGVSTSTENTSLASKTSQDIVKVSVPLWLTRSNLQLASLLLCNIAKIESDTRCSIEISHANISGSIPMSITLTASGDGGRCGEAKRRVKDTLMRAIKCKGTTTRLIYEFSAAESSQTIIKQSLGEKVVWMKVIDLPRGLDYEQLVLCIATKEKCLQKFVRERYSCSLEFFFHGRNLADVGCPPFALVFDEDCARGINHVTRAALLVEEVVSKFTERNPQDDIKPAKKQKLVPRTLSKLTIPSWVMNLRQNNNELYGDRVESIYQATNCQVVFHRSGKSESPMVLELLAEESTSFHFASAVKMIQGFLVDFIKEANSKWRLLYDLAMQAQVDIPCKDTQLYCKSNSGSVRLDIRLDVTRKSVQKGSWLRWVTILDLPIARDSKGRTTAHGKFLLQQNFISELIGDKDCFVKVYGFDNNVPVLVNPYVLIHGRTLKDVEDVMQKVASKLVKHQSRCGRCKFLNDNGTS